MEDKILKSDKAKYILKKNNQNFAKDWKLLRLPDNYNLLLLISSSTKVLLVLCCNISDVMTSWSIELIQGSVK